MGFTTYAKPQPLTADDVRWFEEMIRLQANVPTAGGKLPKKKKPKDKK